MRPASDTAHDAASDRTERLLAVVREVVADTHARERMPPTASLDSSLDRDLGLDSLARVELLVRIERRFAVRLPEGALGRVATVRDLLGEIEAVGALAPPVTPGPVEAVRATEPAPASIRTLADALRWHADRHPDSVHVIVTDGEAERERVSYGALHARAAAMAGALVAGGLSPGERAALMLPTGLDFLTSFFAVLYADAVPVPLYPPATASRIEDHLVRESGILENCEASVLVTLPEVRALARSLRARVPSLREVWTPAEIAGGGSDRNRETRPGTALLQYTSGSTGHPKGVVLTHDNLLANIRAMGRAVRIAPQDVFVSWLPLYHDMGLIGAWLGSLYFGIPLVLMSPLDFLQRPERWLRSIGRYRGTLSGGPNFAYELCVKRIQDEALAGLDLASWRFAFNGAEAVSATTLQRFAARYAQCHLDPRALAPVYGLAECSVGLAFTPPGRGPAIESIDRKAFVDTGRAVVAPAGTRAGMPVVGCGYALPDHQARIVDASGEPLPERREGRIQFRGPSATSGYFRNAEATRALFSDSWLESGDLGYLADGELYPTGRVKDVIIRAGRHYHPDELEDAVGRLPGVRQGCIAVFGTTDRASGTEQVVVVAETRETDRSRRATLTGAINALAADVLGTPADRVILAAPHTVPKTSSGKLRRAETRSLYERGLLELGMGARAVRRGRLLAAAARAGMHEAARRAVTIAYAAYAWAVFLLCVLAAAPVLALPFDRARRHRHARRCARLLLRLAGLMPAVSGLGALPRGGERCILVANHASYIDGIVLTAALPLDFRFVAKRALASRWWLRIALRALDAVLVESLEPQHGAEAGAALAQAAADRTALVVFAEGTFRRLPGVLPFHLGAFMAAAQSAAKVVPVALSGTRRVLPDGTWRPRRAALAVVVFPPLAPSDASFSAAVALRDAARDAIERASGEGAAV